VFLLHRKYRLQLICKIDGGYLNKVGYIQYCFQNVWARQLRNCCVFGCLIKKICLKIMSSPFFFFENKAWIWKILSNSDIFTPPLPPKRPPNWEKKYNPPTRPPDYFFPYNFLKCEFGLYTPPPPNKFLENNPAFKNYPITSTVEEIYTKQNFLPTYEETFQPTNSIFKLRLTVTVQTGGYPLKFSSIKFHVERVYRTGPTVLSLHPRTPGGWPSAC